MRVDPSPPSQGSARYGVFISYSHADAAFAKWIHRKLEGFVVPKELRPSGDAPRKSLGPVFLDTVELASSPDLTASLEAALAQSQFLVVVCSCDSARSTRVDNEVATFLRLHGPARIIPVIVNGRPNSAARGGLAEDECFPSAVRVLKEPLAADAREKSGGRANALLQIVASVLGVGLDSLRQRELQRRNRRLVQVAATSVLASIVLAALSLYAWSARRQAIASEARATFEARSAEQVTEFLVELFAISNPSESAGNRVTAREILDRGASRLQIDLRDSPQLRARLERVIGTVYRQLGLYERAKPFLESAYANTSSNNLDELSPSLFQLALLNSAIDQRKAAETHLRHGIGLLKDRADQRTNLINFRRALAELQVSQAQFKQAKEELLAATALLGPGDSLMRAELLESSARLFREQAQFNEAERDLKQALNMREQLQGASHPDLSSTLYDLALLYQESGNLVAALENASKSLAITEKIYGSGHPDTSNAVQQVGILHAQQGRFKEALPYFERSLAARIEALGPTHTNTGYSWYNLGHLYFDMGDLSKSREMFERARVIWEESQGKDHPDVAYALDKQAEVEIRLDKLESAEQLLTRALAINQAAFAEDHPNVARTLLNFARLRRAQHRNSDARDYFNSALEIRIAKFGADSDIVRSTREEFSPE